ncbi:MAG: rod-binding protein [Pseudohongiellaceae bacterium]
MEPSGPGAQFALDLQGFQRMRNEARRQSGEGLQQAAEQFEAQLLQMMLKSMREATPRSGLMDSQQTSFYEDLMDQQWAQHLAGRGIGLAEQLVAQLRESQDFAGTVDNTGNDRMSRQE